MPTTSTTVAWTNWNMVVGTSGSGGSATDTVMEPTTYTEGAWSGWARNVRVEYVKSLTSTQAHGAWVTWQDERGVTCSVPTGTDNTTVAFDHDGYVSIAWKAWTSGSMTVLDEQKKAEAAQQDLNQAHYDRNMRLARRCYDSGDPAAAYRAVSNCISALVIKPDDVAATELLELAKARFAQHQADVQRRHDEQMVQKKAASKRAESLLLANLKLEQRETYAKDRSITVRGSLGGVFKICRGWSGNVKELDASGRQIRSFCIHPRELVPDEDNVLAQKLILETDEASFRQTANVTPLIDHKELVKLDKEREEALANAG